MLMIAGIYLMLIGWSKPCNAHGFPKTKQGAIDLLIGSACLSPILSEFLGQF